MNLMPAFEAIRQWIAYGLILAGVVLAVWLARQMGALLDELFPPEDAVEDELYRRRDREWPEDK